MSRCNRAAISGCDGQASVELAGGVAAVLLLAFVGFQLLAVGYGAVMADHAAEAAALALAVGGDPDDAAAAAVPGWPKDALRVRSALNRVEVTLLPPTALSFLRGRLAVTGAAAVRPRPRGGSVLPHGPSSGPSI
jgi:hypothetical protein